MERIIVVKKIKNNIDPNSLSGRALSPIGCMDDAAIVAHLVRNRLQIGLSLNLLTIHLGK
jgi:hypothetical protein